MRVSHFINSYSKAIEFGVRIAEYINDRWSDRYAIILYFYIEFNSSYLMNIYDLKGEEC